MNRTNIFMFIMIFIFHLVKNSHVDFPLIQLTLKIKVKKKTFLAYEVICDYTVNIERHFVCCSVSTGQLKEGKHRHLVFNALNCRSPRLKEKTFKKEASRHPGFVTGTIPRAAGGSSSLQRPGTIRPLSCSSKRWVRDVTLVKVSVRAEVWTQGVCGCCCLVAVDVKSVWVDSKFWYFELLVSWRTEVRGVFTAEEPGGIVLSQTGSDLFGQVLLWNDT